MSFGWSVVRDSGYLSSSSGTGALAFGNATTSMTGPNLTVLTAVSGVDDGFGVVPVNFTFNFFGVNYGNGLNNGIYWNTNNVIGFGTGNGTITWGANTGIGVLIGNADRRTNTFYYTPTQTASGYNYVTFIIYEQNIYNDGVPNAVQLQIRLLSNGTFQYIEVRCKQAPATAGAFNLTNGTTFQNTYGGYSGMVANQSFVLAGNSTGSTWTFYNNAYVNV